MRPPLELRIHDAHVGIWQSNPRDPSFRDEVYAELIRRMRARGWSIRQDPHTHRYFKSLSPDRRLGARGTLRCGIAISGRVIEVEYWSTTAPQSNSNGRRYDFDRLHRMHYLDRLRLELEFRRLAAWLDTIAPVTVSRGADGDMSPMARIAKSYAESWHKDKTLGRPVCKYDANCKAGDGALLVHGQTVWLPDRSGRIVRGTAFYNINNMWWVVAGGQLYNEGCPALFTSPPVDLRTKRNERARRNRLERELALAIERMDFQRGHMLKTILFGGEPAFMIWARCHSAYYRSQYAGYTKDRISAGKYTKAEAEAECRRVPHELSMVDQDGNHTRFDRVPA